MYFVCIYLILGKCGVSFCLRSGLSTTAYWTNELTPHFLHNNCSIGVYGHQKNNYTIMKFKSFFLHCCCYLFLLTSCDPSLSKVLTVTDYNFTNEQKLLPLDVVLDVKSIEDNHLKGDKKDKEKNKHKNQKLQYTSIFIDDARNLFISDTGRNLFKLGEENTFGHVTCTMTYSKDNFWGVGYIIAHPLTLCYSMLMGMPVGADHAKHKYDFIIYDVYDREVAKYSVEASAKDNYGLYHCRNLRANQLEVYKKCLKRFYEAVSVDAMHINNSLIYAQRYLENEREKCLLALSEPNYEFEEIRNLAQIGDTESIISLLNDFIDRNEYYSTAYHLRGQLYYNNKKYVQALADFERCCLLNPTDSDQNMYLALSKLLYEIGRREDALHAAKKATRLDVEKVDSYIFTGTILAHLNSFSLANEAYRQALVLDPNQIQLISIINQLENFISDNNKSAENLEINDNMQMLNAIVATSQSVANSASTIATSIKSQNTQYNVKNNINVAQQSSNNPSKRASLELQLTKAKKMLHDAQENQSRAKSPVIKQQYNSIIAKQEELIITLEQQLRY